VEVRDLFRLARAEFNKEAFGSRSFLDELEQAIGVKCQRTPNQVWKAPREVGYDLCSSGGKGGEGW